MPGRRTPPAEPGARDKLTIAALGLFTQKGYAATTVREIVGAAGVTKPVLYYYFRSKEGVYLEILQRAVDAFQATLEGLPADDPSAEAGLRNLCDAAFVLFREHVKVVRLVNSIFYGPPQGAPAFPVEAFHELFSQAILHRIDEGILSGEFRKGDRDVMTLAVLGALHVATEIELMHGVGAVGREGLMAILDIVFEGMRAGKAAKEKSHGKR